jgi:hypothetical protein
MLQIAIIFNFKATTADTVGAYLYQVYPTDKPKLITKLHPTIAEICCLDPEQEYEVVKYIYGLPDSGKAYYEAYSKHLMENGYLRSKFDICLFYRIDNDERTYICIHVDDTFIFSNAQIHIDRVLQTIQNKFTITTNQEADSYLGIFLKKLPEGVQLLQPKLIDTIIQNYQSQIQHPPTTVTTKDYQKLLGTLMYLIKSRPDISTSISFAASKSKNPTVGDYQDLLAIANYIITTKDDGLILHKHEYDSQQPLQLFCHVDASYLSHEDSRSHTGYTISFGSKGCFHSKSTKQTLVSTSSTHAEARALYALTQDINYILGLCSELEIQIQLPVEVYEDNLPVVQLTNNLAPKMRKCKHFLMLLNYIKELIDHNIIRVQHIDSNDNLADILTKLMKGPNYRNKAKKLLGIN